MKLNVYAGIAIRIIIICGIGMFWTFIPDYLRPFFGDEPCQRAMCGLYDENWSWGARHYWFWWMMFLLFILSTASAVIQIIKLVKQNYDTSDW